MSATPHERSRRRDAGENLDVLLDAAARVLADDPAATIADIAAQAGLGRVTAWRHLGSREELLTQLNERAVEETRAALEHLLGDAPAAPEDVGRAVEALAGVGSRYRVLYIAQPAAALRGGREAALAPLTRAIRRGQQAGKLRDDVPPKLAAMLASATAHSALQEAAGDTRRLKRALPAARRFAQAGLTPTPATGA